MKNKTWKVEFRTTCKMCGDPLPNARYRTYCSTKCRNRRNSAVQQKSGYNTEYQRMKRDEIAKIPSPDKVQCLICGKWYVQLCTHTVQVHKMTGREYREYFDLEVKRGVIPAWYRKVKGDKAIENETYKNLKVGEKYRFKKGSKTAGVYHRSHITVKRLKNLHKLNKVKH